MNACMDHSTRSGLTRGSRLKRSALFVVMLLVILAFAAACASKSITLQTGPSSNNPAVRSRMLKYSQCMRNNGVPDFPAPNANGPTTVHAKPGSDLDPNSPAFKAANNICKPLMSTPSASQQRQVQQRMAQAPQYTYIWL